jgi:hypothetical protein
VAGPAATIFGIIGGLSDGASHRVGSSNGFRNPARVSRTRRIRVGIKVIVGEGESVAQAIERFEQLRYFVYRRPWTKRRFGYFEKPSVVRRREARLRRMRRQGCGWYHRFPIKLDAQWTRSGPANTIGR